MMEWAGRRIHEQHSSAGKDRRSNPRSDSEGLRYANQNSEHVNADRNRRCTYLLGEEDGNGSGSSALQLLGSLWPQTPAFSWGFSPPRTGRGGWRLEWLFGSPVTGEFADANSFLGVGLLTAAPKREP